ncbi:hypothetical protein [Pseudomonas oryzihabitans]|uniref:hypothetical protein n=1 Tax=Pseudomonas oryzihabitans TaxID=47885 RepID=UPI00285E99B0|nr:hypothetical protein [Pseudomonas psychrotolerans]MDR6676800.1 hypothetical protein [Pseudomonas psychrotolerans]
MGKVRYLLNGEVKTNYQRVLDELKIMVDSNNRQIDEGAQAIVNRRRDEPGQLLDALAGMQANLKNTLQRSPEPPTNSPRPPRTSRGWPPPSIRWSRVSSCDVELRISLI